MDIKWTSIGYWDNEGDKKRDKLEWIIYAYIDQNIADL